MDQGASVNGMGREEGAESPHRRSVEIGSAGRPGDSGGGSGVPTGPEGEGGVLAETRKKVARPDKYKVLLYNDDFTPMEFVVSVLEQIFGKGPSAATHIMLQIHRTGLGVAGVYHLEIAETKVTAVHQAAGQRGYPLRAGVEKE